MNLIELVKLILTFIVGPPAQPLNVLSLLLVATWGIALVLAWRATSKQRRAKRTGKYRRKKDRRKLSSTRKT
jgi:hypothetical protein